MDKPLTADEQHWLQQLDTVNPQKPELPAGIGERLVELGLTIRLVEGGYQLTALGRDRLKETSERS